MSGSKNLSYRVYSHVEIAEHVELFKKSGLSYREYAWRESIPPSNLQRWVTSGRKTTPQKAKTRTPQFADIEHELKKWLDQKIDQNTPIKNENLQRRALHYAKKLHVVDFRASDGWITSFKCRHGYSYRTPTKTLTKTVFSEKRAGQKVNYSEVLWF